MKVGLLALWGSLMLVLHVPVSGFGVSRMSSLYSKKVSSFRLASDKDNEVPEDAVPLNSPEVKYVLGELMKTLEKSAGMKNADDMASTDDMIKEVDAGFAKLLSEIKGSSKLTETQKRLLTAETALTMSDAKEGDGNAAASASASMSTDRLGENPVKTLVYSQQVSPYLIVHGPGPVGRGLVAFMKSLGSSVSVKYIDASTLAIAPESEIDYAVRDCRSVIIAADADADEIDGAGGGLFGGLGGGSKRGNVPSFVVNEKSLKRLLNACMNQRKRKPAGEGYNVKVVALAPAAKQPKSLASLLGGETFSIENEVLLQCQRRQIDYAVVKVGSLVRREGSGSGSSGSGSFEKNDRLRPRRVDSAGKDNIPFVFTRSRVEPGEVTETPVAVEAVLRAASHPQTNSTVSVVSIDPLAREPSDAEWDDEFQKIDGPELLRIPLRYASELQMAIKMGRVAAELQAPGRGLVTPIEVERYANGVKILFRPQDSSYMSSKEEREREREREGQAVAEAPKKDARMGNYVPPEAMIDAKEAAGAKKKDEGGVKSKPKRKYKPEGGLEVIVDSEPYKRVRIRRCNMGPDPVVKEESEALILKALQQAIRNLEAFYEKMVTEGMDEL